jgi:hypothetical protein
MFLAVAAAGPQDLERLLRRRRFGTEGVHQFDGGGHQIFIAWTGRTAKTLQPDTQMTTLLHRGGGEPARDHVTAHHADHPRKPGSIEHGEIGRE